MNEHLADVIEKAKNTIAQAIAQHLVQELLRHGIEVDQRTVNELEQLIVRIKVYVR